LPQQGKLSILSVRKTEKNPMKMKTFPANKYIYAISILLLFFSEIIFAQTVTRGAYLQSGTQTSIVIRWRTSVNTNSRVRIATSYLATGLYATVIDDATSVTEHSVTVTGLTADTKYFYSVGSTTAVLQVSTDNFFRTLPTANPGRVLRFVAFGDCGRGNTTYQDQNFTNYRNFLTANGIDAPDAWMLLGDNAYNAGTDAEYTTNFFGIYGATILRNHKLYAVPGNHDYANTAANQDTHSLCPYYSIFSQPILGEAGGFASGKEEYYSYDVGNVHFLALDAYGEESNLRLYDTTGAQAVWVKQDLAANTKKWTIAYWHHPPYTMGSHNSDTETELINMRSNFIRILERYGVDMIVCGHSHNYERSYLIKGHYGLEATFNSATMAVNTSAAGYTSNSTCPYTYNSAPLNHGTVYVVAGSTGASGVTQAGYPHNAFPWSVNDGGVFYFEVDDNRLNAQFLRRDGTVFDKFTIMKDVNKSTTYNIVSGSSLDLTASWPGNYSWNTTAITKTITITPSLGSHSYSVSDNFGCVTDNFTVNVSATLPVTLLNYSAAIENGRVNLKWSTATETNSKEFTVERSASPTGNFQPIGKLIAAGQSTSLSNYFYTDDNPLIGTSYYRLSQTDIDGRVQYYELKKITNNKGFKVKQVRGDDGKLVMEIYSGSNDNGLFKIYDLSGKEIVTASFFMTAGENRREVELKRGNYIVEIRSSRGERFSQLVLVK
jgi:hypothetical protein